MRVQSNYIKSAMCHALCSTQRWQQQGLDAKAL